MYSDSEIFEKEVKENIDKISKDEVLQELGSKLLSKLSEKKYSFSFKWMGLPIIQTPQDIVAMQQIIWQTKPDVIIDCGIARGGSLVFNASMLHLLSMCDGKDRRAIGVDIDIREHNKIAIESSPVNNIITMIEGSSIDSGIISRVHKEANKYERKMVCLDSNHTFAHVFEELKAYAPLVSSGCYCIVFDTGVEKLPVGSFTGREWGALNGPLTAIREFMKSNKDFIIDKNIENMLVLTAAGDGFLRRK